MSRDETYDGEKDPRVVTPSPLEAAESHPGKRVIDGMGIDNVDLRNAIYISFLDSLKDRALALSVEIKEQLRESDGHPLLPRNEVGIAVLEMHVLTLSYFEGVAFQFCRWALEMDNEMAEIVVDHTGLKFSEDIEIRERNKKVLSWYESNAAMGLYKQVMKDAGYIGEIYNTYHDVRDLRGTYIHHPEALFKELKTREAVEQQVDTCVSMLAGLDLIVEKYLPVDSAIYDAFRSD